MNDEPRRRFVVTDGLGVVSTSVAVLVGLTSIYATTQAMRMTQASAQERLFDNQMSACLSLNATASRINANFGDLDAALEAFDTDRSAARKETLRLVLEENDERYADLHQEALKLKMLMPSQGVSNTIYEALDGLLLINNEAWDILERNAVTPAERAALTAAEDKHADLLVDAGDACAAHITAIVRGEARVS